MYFLMTQRHLQETTQFTQLYIFSTPENLNPYSLLPSWIPKTKSHLIYDSSLVTH
jgi:hypothetical protein